ncbi:MAG TPA: hypothetical protein VKA21_11420 [Candidatus Binatia bacterium]|nr:hypothetical protein [Candidatus Binatia bacterium]
MPAGPISSPASSPASGDGDAPGNDEVAAPTSITSCVPASRVTGSTYTALVPTSASPTTWSAVPSSEKRRPPSGVGRFRSVAVQQRFTV